MHLSQINILNLWGKDKISINFKNRVSFLTGINGSGKSTLLNIIYDTLNNTEQRRHASTSKYRFWSSYATFDNEFKISYLSLPEIEKPSDRERLEKIVEKKSKLHSLDTINDIKEFYSILNDNNKKLLSYISYTNDYNGEAFFKSFEASKELDRELSVKGIYKKALAFIYQEDRINLHDIDKNNIDLSKSYWKTYKSSIDTRFSYLRDAIQIHESYISKDMLSFVNKHKTLSLDNMMSSELSTFMEKSNELSKVIAILDKYFNISGKEIGRDSDNKITLKYINEDEYISWPLLSRGEKTILYLFFMVFLYKDRISLFLLDEPEISLHVKWQHDLIKDLSDLAPDCQFIIATHSPSLVQNNWIGNCLEISKE